MKYTKLILATVSLSLFAMQSEAAFVVKQQKGKTTEQQSILPPTANTSFAVMQDMQEYAASPELQQMKTEKMATANGGAEISKGLYIVLAIFGLGWLGMGLNDNFKGDEWLISLLLYILLWLPGFIYTLVKMKKYYK